MNITKYKEISDKDIFKNHTAIRIMHLSDLMYGRNNLPNRTASSLLYFNLVEYFLVSIVKLIPLSIDENKFIKQPLGGKISTLKRVNFNYKEELIEILKKINHYRIKIVHNMVDSVADKQMDKLIIEVKKLFDDFKLILCSILRISKRDYDERVPKL
ncbi:MAG TPA: hypothetical protein VJB63_01500 [Patescibacteria group bacterium]|nr:hypothetical protein [Patescibacteria group bacterium]